ncbi:MAG: CHASE3 domain-containing protein [Pyrinomonadaceae bacterium]|nr:CHASE3 domain-containing protein [Pyrinomonadaceae bacterium]
MRLTLERQIPLVFTIAILLLIIVAFFAYRSTNSLTESLKWEKHTQGVLLQLDETLILMIDVETGGRGFMLTGEESYLEPYNSAVPKIGGNLARLKTLVADNPKQQAVVSRLETVVNERLVVAKQVIELRRRTQSIEEVRAQVGKNRGKDLMDEIRSLINNLKIEEQKLLTEREADLSKSLTDTYRMVFFGGLLGISALGLANFAVYREVGKRAKAENALKESNKGLESRVGERTAELTHKNAELEEQIKQRGYAEIRRRVALDVGGLGTWKLNVDGMDGEMDERTLAVFGLSKDDFDGSSKKAFSRVIEEDAPKVDEEFRKSVIEKINFDAEFRIRDSKGEIRWNNCTGQPQLDENGSVTHVVGFCRDVTESKKNEIALRDSESFVRSILDSLPAHIAVINRSGEIVAVNQAWQNFSRLNCLEDRIISTGVGQNYLGVCETSAAFEESTKDVVEDLRAVLNGESKGFSFEYPCHPPTEERWFVLQASAMNDGAVISHIDISARKRAETELKNSEEFNRSIFENSPDCIKVLNLDGTLHTMNTNGLCILEIGDFATVAGKPWDSFWEGDEQELAFQAVQTAANGKTAHFEGFSKTIKGTLKYWDVSVAPVFDGAGSVVRLISTSRDITDRRESEKERERLLNNEKAARREAEIANRMRDEFLATVSHELRAPLNSILGWGRLLQKGQLDEPTTEKAISTIVRNAESQNRLIEDLLDVSRIISGKLRLEVMTIKPINIVESALETVRPAAEAKGIKIEIIGGKEVSHISGDPNRLQQVIWNLLSNAIKFTPQDGTVKLEIERRDDFVEIRVKDSGIGLKEDFLPYVFDRFRQADASSIRKFGGLGLGLAIVRHITEMHGGTVHAESAGENQGSTFIVRLPLLVQSDEESDAMDTRNKIQTIEPDTELQLTGMLILVVDDEEDTRQLLVQSLTFYGATVITADSAEQAFIEVQAKNPDLMVSDIGMPDEDGYSLIRRVRALPDKQHNSIPAIALTAFTRAQDRMRALTSGYQNHVSKPVEPDELATVIASLTGRLRNEK